MRYLAKWLWMLVCLPVLAQDAQPHVGLPIDWSARHIVVHNKVDATFDRLAGRDPRIVYNWLQRAHARGPVAPAPFLKKFGPTAKSKFHGDWHFTLGNGTVAFGMSPAKYTFNVNSTPDCTNDYVVYALNTAPSPNQPNLIGFNNLYSGTSPTGICGTAPTVKFAYSIGSGAIDTSPVIGPDGSKVAFVSSDGNLYVVKLGTDASSTANGYFDSANNVYVSATPESGNNASVQSYTFGTSATLSSLFVDYSNDWGYFGDDSGNVYKTTCVFFCSGSVIPGSKIATLGTTQLAPVVVDVNTGMLFVGNASGVLYSLCVNSGTCLDGTVAGGASSSVALGTANANGAIIDGVLLDVTFRTLFVTTGSAASNTKPAAFQLKEGSPPSSLFSVGGNSAFWPTVSGALNDAYYNNSIGGTAATGNAYFCLNGTGQGQAFYFNQAFGGTFTSSSITSATVSGTTATITTSGSLGVSAGDVVVVAGVTNTGYNGTWTVTSVAGTSFSFTDSNPGLASSSGGTATRALSVVNPPIMNASSTSHNLPGNPGFGCSPIVTFTSGSTERLFLSQNNVSAGNSTCSTASTKSDDGCIFSYALTSGALGSSPTTTFSLHGFTSGLVFDNTSSQAQAASLYFATESKDGVISGAGNTPSTTAPSCPYTNTAGTLAYCAVKLTQSTLQ